jgi:UDPglucose--hexose-1-phosphate uridylyltransferase
MGSTIDIIAEIEKLIKFSTDVGFVHPDDAYLIRNSILDFLCINKPYYKYDAGNAEINKDDILSNILQYLYESHMFSDTSLRSRDLMIDKIMGIVAPRPAVVKREFKKHFDTSPLSATDYLYKLYQDLCFIHEGRVSQRSRWQHQSKYGTVECVSVFTEPTKDIKQVATTNKSSNEGYPKCRLCPQVVGSSGTMNNFHGENLRTVPLELAGKTYSFGYAWQQYYNEQCIVAYTEHEGTAITKGTFLALLDFVKQFPHYFMGTNADLPMIGASEHLRFHGGCDVMPIEDADVDMEFTHPEYECGFRMLNWPVPCIRLESYDEECLALAAEHINKCWKEYPFKDFNVPGKERHNAVSAVARRNLKGNFEMDIFLRNNCGEFNAPKKHTDIKRSITGIYDLMGLFIIGAEIDSDILHVMSYLMSDKEYVRSDKEDLIKYEGWILYLQDKYGVIENFDKCYGIMKQEIGAKFIRILEYCGVFRCNEQGRNEFIEFLNTAGLAAQL